VLDEGDIAYRASRGNFGLVWVQGKGVGMAPYAHWTRQSSELWPRLAEALGEECGHDVALRQPGGLHFCLSDEEFEERAVVSARMHNESGGNGTRMIGRAELRDMVPAIGDAVVGASFCPIDGHANPLYLLRALHEGMQLLGATYLPGRTVDRIAADDGAFAVQSGAELFAAKRIVIAAGLGSARLAPMVGLHMPVAPLRGEIIVTERVGRFLDFATHTVRQTDEGSVMLGDSQEEVGFDTGTSLPVLQGIASRALTAFPLLRDANIVRTWSALRVMTPDGYPIYEQSRTHPGAFAATCHSGVTLAGAHALVLARAIMAGALPESFDVFGSARFDVPAA
jgi:glycine/D-amino acid oxidase-like deaminating enzyme